jgi:hypothetical protein
MFFIDRGAIMTVYRVAGPSLHVRGRIEEVLGVLSLHIQPGEYYWIDEAEDLTGAELMARLIDLRDRAEAPDTYVERVSFSRRVGGAPGEYLIERVNP